MYILYYIILYYTILYIYTDPQIRNDQCMLPSGSPLGAKDFAGGPSSQRSGRLPTGHGSGLSHRTKHRERLVGQGMPIDGGDGDAPPVVFQGNDHHDRFPDILVDISGL